MKAIISISIDLNKIDKSKIIEGKNGAKYYNLTLMVNEQKDRFNNDCSVIEPQTKEQREAGMEKKYLGNGRLIWTDANHMPATPNLKKEAANNSSHSSDLPF